MVRGATVQNKNADKLKLAAAALLTLPGTPFIYYGEEIGLENGMPKGKNVDQEKRTPMPWDTQVNHVLTTLDTRPWWPFSSDSNGETVESQISDQTSLLRTYRALIQLRNSDTTLNSGSIKILQATNKKIVAFVREADHSLSFVLHNFSAETVADITLSFPMPSSEKKLLTLKRFGDHLIFL